MTKVYTYLAAMFGVGLLTLALFYTPPANAQVTVAPVEVTPLNVVAVEPVNSAPTADVVVTDAPVSAPTADNVVSIDLGGGIAWFFDLIRTFIWPALVWGAGWLAMRTPFGQLATVWLKDATIRRLGEQGIENAVGAIKHATKDLSWDINMSSAIMAKALNFLINRWPVVIDLFGGKEALKQHILALIQPYMANDVSGSEIIANRIVEQANGQFKAIDERGATLADDAGWLRQRAGSAPDGWSAIA